MGVKTSKMAQKRIRPVSSKQAAKVRAYKRAKAQIEQELKSQGKWVCIFSGQPIPDWVTWKEVDWHHLKGRDGDLISDPKYIRPYLDEKYHTGDDGCHNHTVKELSQFWWFDGFMKRLKEIDYDLWYSHYLKL